MKIMMAHNRYIQHGGEDSVLASETKLLRSAGHDVVFHGTDNDGIKGFGAKLEAARRAVYSQPAREAMARALADHNPDVLHVHNFFPRLTPSIYDAAAEAGVAVVQTLHNYRIICPGAQLMRDGVPCELCVGSSPYRAVRYRCYRGSTAGTLAVAHMVATHQRRNTWSTKIHRIIALTEFARQRFIAGGIEPSRIVVKPNFIVDPGEPERRENPRNGAIFVGRLSQEKGVRLLLEAWRELEQPLSVYGDGPQHDELAASCPQSVTLAGRRDWPEVLEALKGAQFMVLPSLWYEGFPMVLVEAFAAGLPVLCSDIGGMAEIVKDGVTGLHFRVGDAADLRAKAEQLLADPEACRRMGAAARKEFLERFSDRQNLAYLERIYGEAVAMVRAERKDEGRKPA